MAIILARGWESGHTMLNAVDRQVPSLGSVSLTGSDSKTGTYSLRLYSTQFGTAWARWAVANIDEPSVSLWALHGGSIFSDNSSIVIRLYGNDGDTIDIQWNGATHTLDAYVGGESVASGSVEVSTNDWFHVQIYCTVAASGTLQVLINGHESINYSGDTRPGTSTNITYIYILSSGGNTNDAEPALAVDDLVIADAVGLLGDLRVNDKRPSADDATAQWTPSTGADNYAVEDETPPSDADYNEAATDGLIDQFELSALDIAGFTCEAVVAWSRAKMTDGVGDSIDVGIYSGSTASVNRSALSTDWEYYWGDVEETDPDDSAAWNQAKLDALLHRKVAVIT